MESDLIIEPVKPEVIDAVEINYISSILFFHSWSSAYVPTKTPNTFLI